ncbi:phage major capsid protein [Phascolarctobacterium succinatutens]|uniref:phage major capsid protein n=1 Tax=Phascolarctobacterium succinatutens TaxID=626940 RepID=UPI0023FA2A4C|nr:phage major capsid protein [Phascolarctobacterium succinatutens]
MEFKQLLEKRNELVEKVNQLFSKCEEEKRAFNEEEKASYEAMSKEIKDIDETVRMFDTSKTLADGKKTPASSKAQADFEKESRAFASYVREGKIVETREAVNMTNGDNGAIIPSTIANKIIETVENICPIFNLTTKYNVKGTLSFPVYDESVDKVQCAYATEFSALDSHTGKFTNVALKGYLVGALTKISKSLINNAQFDVVSYVISKVSLAIARFLEKEALLGAGGSACEGVLVGASQIVKTASATAIVADELIDLQMAVPQQYQEGACWIMSLNTLKAIRKLKDADGDYLLNKDLTMGFGYALLGKHVYISDNMPEIGATNKVVVYGDMSGLYSNLRPSIEMQMLMEKYADEHAIGVVTWFEVDTKVIEKQKVAVLAMKES